MPIAFSSHTTSLAAAEMSPAQRLEVLFDGLAELTGQRNAVDGRIVEIVAEIDHDELWGSTGARSVRGLVAWKLGVLSANAGRWWYMPFLRTDSTLHRAFG